ncbi:MAG: SDR family NAD(P)-dependent oxidoreductase [Hyphomicrobiaceae bacterium]
MTGRLPWKTAWITGASSGIGRQLAVDLADAGVTVAASARSAERLAELAAARPNIKPHPVDVADREAVRAAAARMMSDVGTPDLAILNAGVWHPMQAKAFDAEKSSASMAVNYLGITYALEALLPAMIERRAGHVALVASVAGYRGLPLAAAYAPSKAAVIALAESLALELPRHGVTVSIVNPGFVDTPMTAVNKFPMPFKIGVHAASRTILSGLSRGKYEIAFPWRMALMMKALRTMPNQLFLQIGRRL